MRYSLALSPAAALLVALASACSFGSAWVIAGLRAAADQRRGLLGVAATGALRTEGAIDVQDSPDGVESRMGYVDIHVSIKRKERPGSRLGPTKLGILQDTRFDDGNGILIESVTKGLIPSWNANQRKLGLHDNVLRKGDRIISVNGVMGDARTIVDECALASKLDMVVVGLRDLNSENRKVQAKSTKMKVLGSTLSAFREQGRQEVEEEAKEDNSYIVRSEKVMKLLGEDKWRPRSGESVDTEMTFGAKLFAGQIMNLSRKGMPAKKVVRQAVTWQLKQRVRLVLQRRGRSFEEIKYMSERDMKKIAFEDLLNLEKGEKIEGQVSFVGKKKKNSVYIDMPPFWSGIQGWIPSNRLLRVSGPSDALKVGDKVDVFLDSVDWWGTNFPRIVCTQKPPEKSKEWWEQYTQYTPDQWVMGNISGVQSNGVLVKVPPPGGVRCDPFMDWVEGFVAERDIEPWNYQDDPRGKLIFEKKGFDGKYYPQINGYDIHMEVPVRVVQVDLEKMRLRLSMKPPKEDQMFFQPSSDTVDASWSPMDAEGEGSSE